jgi:hypothetical protein
VLVGVLVEGSVVELVLLVRVQLEMEDSSLVREVISIHHSLERDICQTWQPQNRVYVNPLFKEVTMVQVKAWGELKVSRVVPVGE